MITLRTWPPAKDGAKRWAVQWERGDEYRREVFTDEAKARARYEEVTRASHTRARSALAARVKQQLALEPEGKL